MIEKYLKYAPLSLFGIYFLKATIFTVSYPEAAILAVLGATACYFQSKNNEAQIKILEDKILASNKVLENKVLEAIGTFEKRVNEVESIKAQINAFKVNSLTRPMSSVRTENK